MKLWGGRGILKRWCPLKRDRSLMSHPWKRWCDTVPVHIIFWRSWQTFSPSWYSQRQHVLTVTPQINKPIIFWSSVTVSQNKLVMLLFIKNIFAYVHNCVKVCAFAYVTMCIFAGRGKKEHLPPASPHPYFPHSFFKIFL